MQKPERNVPLDVEHEYRAIEATLLATARGRWFLAEHGRRARRLDDALLEDALHRINASLREPTALVDQMRVQIALVRAKIAEVRTALEARPIQPRGPSAVDADGALPVAASRPGQTLAQSILSAAESVHELAWTLQGREGRDFDQGTLEQIARQVVAIYGMSRQQAIDTEFTLRLVDRLASADDHLGAVLDSLDHETPAPSLA